MKTNNQKLLISLPQKLVSAVDIAKTEKQISRIAFIRESLMRNLLYYNKHERGVCFPRDLEGLNYGTPSQDRDEICEEVRQPSSEDDQTP